MRDETSQRRQANGSEPSLAAFDRRRLQCFDILTRLGETAQFEPVQRQLTVERGTPYALERLS